MSYFTLNVRMASPPSQQQIQEAIKLLTKHQDFPIVEMVQVDGVWVEKNNVRVGVKANTPDSCSG